MLYREFVDAGYRVFGLYGKNADGKCECGHPLCDPKALFKHPRVSSWQNTPLWSDDQIDVMEESGQFATGYGVVTKEMVIVDVDARNGGLAGYAKLIEDIPEISASGLIVETGSGGGSKHVYFKAPAGVSLVSKHADYPGVDFKSGSAYVVGPGSMHASGRRYSVLIGSPSDIDMAPAALLEKLRVPERHRAEFEGYSVDVSHGDLADMLSHISNNDLEYDVWVKIGMAIHHASGGSAYELWDKWSQTSVKYDETSMPSKWHSFGRSANPVTLATLVYYAEQGGWKRPVTFTPDVEFDIPEPESDEIDLSSVDLTRPPGLVGRVASWIESRAMRSRENLAAISALVAVSNLISLRYTDDITNISPNLFVFCVAGSGTGKENSLNCVREIMVACDIGPCVHGGIKSEQELVRNIIDHQAAFYVIDEIGFLFQKIKNAQKRGGAAYLEGIVGQMMSMYSKANGFYVTNGDIKRQLMDETIKRIAQVEKKLEDGEKDYLKVELESLRKQLNDIPNGIRNPIVSMIGYTTPSNFDSIVEYEAVANGFLGRSMIRRENRDNPSRNERWSKDNMKLPEDLKIALQALAMGGSFSTGIRPSRIEYRGPKIVIPSTAEARRMMGLIRQKMDDLAEEHTVKSGLQALPLRAEEMVSKISLVLAAPEGIRTEEHVRWAYALVMDDINSKVMSVISNDDTRTNIERAMGHIANIIDKKDGTTKGVIMNNCRKYKKEDVEQALKKLVDAKYLTEVETVNKYNKVKTQKYFLTNKK